MLIDFRQPVCRYGYRLIVEDKYFLEPQKEDIEPDSVSVGELVVANFGNGPERFDERYREVQITRKDWGLFRRFMRIENISDIISFANEYGPLGLDKFPLYDIDGQVANIPLNTTYESPMMWYVESSLMRSYYQLSGMDAKNQPIVIQNMYDFPVNAHPPWINKSSGNLIYDNDRKFLNCDVIAGSVARLQPGESRLIWMGQATDFHSSEEYKEFTINQVNAALKHSISLVFEHGKMIFRPKNLRTLLWIQFAEELNGEVLSKDCTNPDCSNSIIIGGDEGRRRNVEFCSQECKDRYHNQRRPKTRAGRKGKAIKGE